MITYTNHEGVVHVLCTNEGEMVQPHDTVAALGNTQRVTSLTPPPYARDGVYVYGTSKNDSEPRYYVVKVESINMKWVPL